MRLRNFLIAVAVLALAVPGLASAKKPADNGFKVTGGGQIITEEAQAEGGPGDTVGFNAHDLDDDGPAARGQFQYIPRGQSGNASAPTEKFHGVVTCLISGGEAIANENAEEDGEFNEALAEGSARFGGHLRDDPTTFFTVDVTDNGEGGNAEDDDYILVRITEEPCGDNPEDEEDDPEQMIRLGRGNVKIHNNPDGEASALANAMTAAAFVQMAL